MPLRCLLVDDNEAFLEAASLLLEREGLTVVGVASSIAEALRQARALRPDVILVDIGLGEESGFDLARLLAEDGQGGAEVILISTGAEADYSELIDESPAAGFLAKSTLSARGISRILDRTPLRPSARFDRKRNQQRRSRSAWACHFDRPPKRVNAVGEAYEPGTAGGIGPSAAIVAAREPEDSVLALSLSTVTAAVVAGRQAPGLLSPCERASRRCPRRGL